MADTNKQIVQQFYAALNDRDIAEIRSLYHPKAVYKDEIFALTYKEIVALWFTSMQPEMDLVVELESIDQHRDTIRTSWTISYTITSIKKRITLKETGEFKLKDGLIIHHTDTYSFHSWCYQAFGLIGKLASWSNWMKNKVRNQALKSISAHIYTANSVGHGL